ncbi:MULTISPECIES: hypothetical protein [unclassified Streptomyces]
MASPVRRRGSSLKLTFGDLTGAFGARQKIQVKLGRPPHARAR